MAGLDHRLGEGGPGNMLVDGQGYRAVCGRRGNSLVELRCRQAVVDHRCTPLSIGIYNNVNRES